MKRGVLILLILLLAAIGIGFLALMWLDMRNSIAHPPAQPHAENRPAERRPREADPERPRERPEHGERYAQTPENCEAAGISCASTYLTAWVWPEAGSCHSTSRNGYPEPDPRCTPGGVVPGITAETLSDPGWRTKCIRNCQSSEAQKHVTYAWYGLARPEQNNGANQVCELDHLVPLEIGGADGLGNIWPECGPDDVTLRERYFKQKDIVENYLAARVRAREMPLVDAQRGIARDWVQYLEPAKEYCRGGRC